MLLGCLATVLLVVVRHRRKTLWKRRIAKALKSIGRECLRDVVVPDGVGDYIHVDYVLLTPHALLVIDVRNYQGAVFGAPRLKQWTRVANGRSHKFDNPLDQNALRVQSVKALVPNVPVTGRVVFTEAGYFPKGVPQGVSMLGTLKDDLAAALGPGEVPESVLGAWGALKEIARAARARIAAS
ncbi:MAG: NERD domain-containing protein [Gammaproteobacteria bacterium]|nr:NERD domain-containing protein [Gammaproteobacteria bacterium]